MAASSCASTVTSPLAGLTGAMVFSVTPLAKASVLPLMRLKAKVPPPATAGALLAPAATATADAVPLATMAEVRQAPT